MRRDFEKKSRAEKIEKGIGNESAYGKRGLIYWAFLLDARLLTRGVCQRRMVGHNQVITIELEGCFCEKLIVALSD